MHYIDGDKWYIEREGTNVLKESLDVDGVTLTVSTNGVGEGQVSYSSDLMAGVGHDDSAGSKPASIIKWLGQEIGVQI